jgi:thioredoxin 1
MIENDLLERVNNNPRPVVIDFWVPWCAPCWIIEPAVKRMGEEYGERVDLWKVIADEQPAVPHSLHILAL